MCVLYENIFALREHLVGAGPDEIILGEIRGTEARTLLDAMNTGHRGGLATIHASSAPGALLRLRTLLMRGTSSLMPAEADAEIRTSIHLVVHIDREAGRRHVREISRFS